MGWLKIRKLEYLEKGVKLFDEAKKILNLYLRWHNLRSYCFVAEVTFTTEAYSELSRTSNMELFAKIDNGFQMLIVITKSSILDVRLGSEYPGTLS